MPPRKKTLSIVMATYNGSKYIGQQLNSISIQTVQPDEVIISDDNSDDSTFEIIEEFKRKSNFHVKIIRRVARLGFRENFLRTSLEARGDFIAFCDQDDVWKEDKIEKCSKYFDDNNISMIVHSAIMIDKSSNVIGKFKQKINKTVIKNPLSYDLWGTFWGFSIIYRRELLNIVSIDSRFKDYIAPNHLAAHDRWITFLGQMVGTIAELDDCLVEYRQHDANVFGQGSGSKFRTTNDIKGRTDLYIEVNLHMLSIIHDMQEDYSEIFPLYNKNECVKFIEGALKQLQARSDIYVEENRLKALRNTYMAILSGVYVNINNNRIRWKSIARDLKFITLRR